MKKTRKRYFGIPPSNTLADLNEINKSNDPNPCPPSKDTDGSFSYQKLAEAISNTNIINSATITSSNGYSIKSNNTTNTNVNINNNNGNSNSNETNRNHQIISIKSNTTNHMNQNNNTNNNNGYSNNSESNRNHQIIKRVNHAINIYNNGNHNDNHHNTHENLRITATNIEKHNEIGNVNSINSPFGKKDRTYYFISRHGSYYDFISKVNYSNLILILPPPKFKPTKSYKYLILKGNNSILIKNCLKQRYLIN